MQNNETEYLLNLIKESKPNKLNLKIKWCEGKEIIGIVGKLEDERVANLYKYETLYRTFLGLNEKISYSLVLAIKYTYTDEVTSDFGVLSSSTENEKLAFYYIENAIFRTLTLWDILAQIYNIYCCINLPIKNIHYKDFFKNKLKTVEKEIDMIVKKIILYLEEEDGVDSERFWKGNHTYIKKYRDQMIHRNAPDEYSFSNIGLNFKPHPSFILKRVIEDNYIVVSFIVEVLNRVNEQYAFGIL